MTLVYSPHAFREIGVVGGDGFATGPRSRASSSALGGGVTGIFWRASKENPCRRDTPRARSPGESGVFLLPGEDRLAGNERRRIAGRRDELDPGTSTRGECSSRKRIVFFTTAYMKAEPNEPGKRRPSRARG